MPHQCLKCGVLFNEGTTTILRGCPECRGTRFFYTQKPLTMSERDKLLATSEVTLREAIDQLVKKAKDGDVTDLPKGPDEWVKVTLEDRPQPSTETRLEDFEAHPESPAPPVKFTPAPTPDASKATQPVVEPSPRRESTWLPGNKLLIKRAPEPAPTRRRKAPIQFDYAPAPAAVLPTPAAFKPEEPSPASAPERREEESPLVDAPEPEIVAPLGEGPPETIRIGKPGEYEIDVKRLLESDPIVIQRDGTYLIHLASLFDSNRPKGD